MDEAISKTIDGERFDFCIGVDITAVITAMIQDQVSGVIYSKLTLVNFEELISVKCAFQRQGSPVFRIIYFVCLVVNDHIGGQKLFIVVLDIKSAVVKIRKGRNDFVGTF